jgi:hypothetical protein
VRMLMARSHGRARRTPATADPARGGGQDQVGAPLAARGGHWSFPGGGGVPSSRKSRVSGSLGERSEGEVRAYVGFLGLGP